MEYKIAVLGGDGVGPAVVKQALKVLHVLTDHTSHRFRTEQGLIGGAALTATGRGLPDETMELCRAADAVLLGAVGGEQWDRMEPLEERPGPSLLRLRRSLGLYGNPRPVRIDPPLFGLSGLKEQALGSGVDLIVLREMSGGIFFGPRGSRMVAGVEEGFDTMLYTRPQVERIAHMAFKLARRRRRKVTSADQANVLESNRLWWNTFTAVAAEYPDVTLQHLYIDNCAYELVKRPHDFDVIVAEGLLAGILSDEAAVIAGSPGMLPSASLGEGHGGLFEPVHGSVPKRVGQDSVNPVATIRSLALLLELALNLPVAAAAIETAIVRVIAGGIRTYDIAAVGCTIVGTERMGDEIALAFQNVLAEGGDPVVPAG